MTVYVLANFEVTDGEAFADYVAHAPAIVAAYGGEYLARGGFSELWEGDATPKRVVVLRFPDAERAHAWYDSPEYQLLREQRQRAASGPLLMTVGVDET
ncbi:DUF1330 domain-containing protein [Cryptosporangium sp. NPDC051539]|uniref:DUF1330 domain-containing protein n=1 Tax=Cryptosporangium sp. NPDC051539 TaxID=3363962 RepID=UPI0037B9B273